MTREEVKQLRIQLNSFLEGFNPDYAVSLGSARFDESYAKFNLEVTKKNNDGSTTPKHETDFNTYCISFGLKPEHLGAKFTFKYQLYEIVGIKPTSYKFPILARRTDGKVFKFRPQDILRQLT